MKPNEGAFNFRRIREELQPNGPWKDEDRMRMLFAPFRPKELNPEAWEAKHQFWRDLINTWMFKNDRVIVTLAELETVFVYEPSGAKPHCLKSILERMKSENLLSAKEHLVTQMEATLVQPSAFSKYVISPAKVFGGYVAKAITGSSTEVDPNQELVSPDRLCQCSEKLLENLRQSTLLKRTSDMMFISESDLKIEAKRMMNLQGEDLQLCIMKCQSMKLLATRTINNTPYFKLENDSSKEVFFSDRDRTLLHIDQVQIALQKDICKKEDSIKELRKEALQALKENSKQRAKFLLKKRKRTGIALEKCLQVAENMEIIRDKIEHAEEQAKIVNTYKKALDSLKEKLKHTSAEDIDELLDELNENLSKNEEITDALSNVSIRDESDDNLEQELAELVAADKKEQDALGQQLDKLKGLEIADGELEEETERTKKKPDVRIKEEELIPQI